MVVVKAPTFSLRYWVCSEVDLGKAPNGLCSRMRLAVLGCHVSLEVRIRFGWDRFSCIYHEVLSLMGSTCPTHELAQSQR